jgi:hypothetical protein
MRGISCGVLSILLTLAAMHVRGDTQIYYPTDADMIMPAYSNAALRNRIEGSVHFRVVFNQQKVESIVVLSSTLKMGAPPLRPSPAYQEPALVREVQEQRQQLKGLVDQELGLIQDQERVAFFGFMVTNQRLGDLMRQVGAPAGGLQVEHAGEQAKQVQGRAGSPVQVNDLVEVGVERGKQGAGRR